MNETELKLSKAQVWIVAKALHFFTSTQAIRMIKVEFPDLDEELLANDIDDIIDQLSRKD